MEMDKPVPNTEPSFWKLPIAPKHTRFQVLFDLIAGLVLPIFCLWIDPVVFPSRGAYGPGLLAKHQIVSYGAIGLGLFTLSTWLLFRTFPAVYAGLLMSGAIFAGCLGLFLLPLSFPALFIGIGVLGFTPFVTAFVFWRNALRAYRDSRSGKNRSLGKILFLAGFLFASIGPWMVQDHIQSEIKRATQKILSSDPDESSEAIQILKRYSSFVNLDSLVWRYESETNPDHRSTLSTIYRDLTGEDIETRLILLRD